MLEATPKICIEGREVDFLKGGYKNDGNLTSASLSFTLPLTFAGLKKLWNKEVTFFLSKHDSVPIFRGWIRRIKETFSEVELYAEDALGYMSKGGEETEAKVNLTNFDNLDGLTAGACIQELLLKIKLNNKLKTDTIGDTDPLLHTSSPFRGTMVALDIVKELLGRAINTDGDLPRPNIGRIVDDGEYSQFIIELESDLETSTPKIIFTEKYNIKDISITKKRIPTVIIVNGDNTSGRFIHDGALEALDRTYLEVENKSLKSPAECKEFGAKVFEANAKNQYEYKIVLIGGGYLLENDVIQVATDDPEFSGIFRIVGKSISFSPTDYSIAVMINRKPPTLAQYISSRDN
tara:strand:+ start:4036 stop:5082 length:1047 start_codon:yes stop_codon:yes gene_type:complete